MYDFSPWDIADSFRLHEAACLIAGVMPLSKRFPDADEIPASAKPVLKKLSTGYYFGTMLDASEAIDSPQNPKAKWLFGIAVDPSDVNLVWKHPRGAIRKGGTTLDMGATILSYLKHAMVSRSELHRWLTATGIKSAYSFAPVATSLDSEPDTAPAQNTATPGPEVAASDGLAPMQRSAAQDAAILREIKATGNDPKCLPANPPGKPGIKSAVRKALGKDNLFTGASVFKHAWERLAAQGDIVIKG